MSNALCSELIKADLPFPEEIKKELGSVADARSNYYFQIIEEFHDRLLLRTFAAKRYAKEGLRVSEVCRRLEGEKPLFSNIGYGYLYGWNAYFSNKEYTPWNKADWFEWDKKNGWFWGKLVNGKEASDKYAKYCPYTPDLPVSLFHFLEIYRAEPKIELLCKSGYGSFVSCYKKLNIKGHNFEQIFRVDKKWAEYLKGKTLNELNLIKKYKPKDVAELKSIKGVERQLRKYIVKNRLKDSVEYLKKVGYFGRHDYTDYIRFADDLGYDLDRFEVRFPNDLKAAHDKAAAEMAKKQESVNKEKFLKQYKKNSKYEFHFQGLMIVPCKDQDELINESEKLHHCVRTYADRVAKGETAIFFIRNEEKKDDPYVTLELKNKSIVQIRGDHNRNPKEVFNFVKEWKKKYSLRGGTYDTV